jgi:hypothetical protein
MGIYSVRSAYKLLYKKKFEDTGDQAPNSSSDGPWKIIWRLPIPPKVKVFWWRVIHEFLPTRHILWKRHIEPVPFCEVCGAPEESIYHVLLECSIAKEFWHQVRVGIGVKMPHLNPLTWATDIISGVCLEKDLAVFLCGMWALWMRRNKKRHDEHLISLQHAVEWVKDIAFDLWNLTHQLRSKGPTQEMQKWRSPAPGWHKVNTDAAFFTDDSCGASACIIRDHRGCLKRRRRSGMSCTMEAIACRDGLNLARRVGVQKVMLETDCLELINLWSKRDTQRSIIDPLLKEIDAIRLAFQ